jgi:fructose-bisphosphate aldolase class I
MDGGHDIDAHFDATVRTQRKVFAELAAMRVDYEGMVLKPNMVLSGKEASNQASPEDVAEQTLRCLYQTVPAAVPGIVFLSGGQSAEVATLHLDLMNKRSPHPWELSFSYGRALQDAALKTWKGNSDNVAEAQKVFTHRSKLTSAAREGNYETEMESEMESAGA